MKIFIDTANIDRIKEINDWGILDGVTTNPSLIAKEGKDLKTIVTEISQIVDGPISAEVMSMDAEGMVAEGLELAKIHPNINIKLPMCIESLKATKVLASKGIKVNVTLIFSTAQALLAAKAGATYVSPFVGRLDDIGDDGVAVIEDIVNIFQNYGIETEIIAASIRTSAHVTAVARAGSDIATVPYKVIESMIGHPMTTSGIDRFLSDWASIAK